MTTYRGAHIRACAACGLGFSDPPPDDVPYEEEDFHLNQAKAPEKSPEWHEYYYRWSWRATLGLVKKALPNGGKVMDIGCGEGSFMRVLRDAGYETFGVEPSRSAATRARESGFNVTQGRLDDFVPSEKMDLVIMSHVLAHIRD